MDLDQMKQYGVKHSSKGIMEYSYLLRMVGLGQ